MLLVWQPRKLGAEDVLSDGLQGAILRLGRGLYGMGFAPVVRFAAFGIHGDGGSRVIGWLVLWSSLWDRSLSQCANCLVPGSVLSSFFGSIADLRLDGCPACA